LKKLQDIEAERNQRLLGNGLASIERQHVQGKLTARERINYLFDTGTFKEIDFWSDTYKYGEIDGEEIIPGDGVVVGWGEVNGRPAYAWAQDATLLNGTMAEVHIAKIVRVMEKALTERVPIVGIYDTEGLRLHSAVMAHSFCSYSTMLKFQTLSSGVIPQIALIMGPCVEGAALSAPLADFVFMVKNKSYLHINPVGDQVTREEYGGAQMHATQTGTCAVLAKSDEECIEKCKELLSFLPQNNYELPPRTANNDPVNRRDEELLHIIPDKTTKGYDMRRIIRLVADDNNYFEILAEYAPNLTVGFARFDGQPVGIIANNPFWLGGCENSKSSVKHARFNRFCDAFNIPIVYFADCPGFVPSVEEEHSGILRRGSMVIHATSEATVPTVSIIVRKIYGGAQLVMPSNLCKTDRIWAWPTVERGTMGADALTEVMFKGRLERAATQEEKAIIRKEAKQRMEKAIARSAKVGNEEIIDPRDTRSTIIQALKSLKHKPSDWPERKHDNINM
ncbi:MAG: methylmalonyl-CoA carboxyltransferase, partial [Syntrophomonadaceae bacterium]|nr:methylmalonyl-CoA carboxyltransferase [Syntrophomonadaceae bacterium]